MYFGSVRFFRQLILTVLVLLIAVPAFFAISFGRKYSETSSKLAEVQSVVSKYDKTGQDELVASLSQLLNNSIDKQIPTFQQQVDVSMGTQLDNLRSQIRDDIKSQMSDVRKANDTSLSSQKEIDNSLLSLNQTNNSLLSQIDSLYSHQSTLQQQLTTTIKSQTAAAQQQMEKKLDEKTAEMMKQFNETLSDQVGILMQQINALKNAPGGKS